MAEKKQASLLQVLGLGTAILLVAGNMIGSGIFKKIAPMAASLMDSKLILAAWIFAGLITMLGAFSFASLAGTTKEAGGQFVYFKNVFGDFFGFIFGWSFFSVISTASIASISYVFAESFVHFFAIPGLIDGSGSNFSVFGLNILDNFTVKAIAIITLLSLTVFNIFGVKGGGRLTDIVTSAKILGILILIGIGLSFTGSSEAPIENLSPAAGVSTSDILRLSAFFTAMLGAFWAYDGWVNITNMASEFKDPTRNVPKAIVLGSLLTMFLYFLINYAFLRVISPARFAEINDIPGSIAAVEVASVAIGPIGITVISALIMISTFGATHVSSMSAARVYYQMSKEGYFFKPFSRVHDKFRTPHISLSGQFVWASVLVMSGTFDQLTDMLIFAAFIFYGLGALAVIKLKMKGTKMITYGYPVIPALFIVCCAGIVINSIYSRPWESLIGLVLILTGVPLYFYFRNRRK